MIRNKADAMVVIGEQDMRIAQLEAENKRLRNELHAPEKETRQALRMSRVIRELTEYIRELYKEYGACDAQYHSLSDDARNLLRSSET